ncbi:hypothetical protein C2845_PM08G02890 [Panicum miliaceum]|uniref:Profilin n=1 Tax=Panicum miliaceum TaxID=4540 RepID=A0A3L6R3C3_PANMI|nr:hypothetical protein C2845_PM08G02890 [Panicum miliaceum]
MSWQAYVDDHLLCDIDGQRLSAAAILGHDGAVWAQSDAFPQVRLPPWLHPSRPLSAPHSFRRDRASKRILKQIVVDANVALTPVKPEEITAIMNDFNEPGSLAPTGLYLGGSKYMVIQGEPGVVIRGKKILQLLAISWLPLVFAKSDERCTREVVNQSKQLIYFEEEKLIPDRTYDPDRSFLSSEFECYLDQVVTIKKTNLAIIIGIYEEPMTPGQCNMVVERLSDYLVDQGF